MHLIIFLFNRYINIPELEKDISQIFLCRSHILQSAVVTQKCLRKGENTVKDFLISVRSPPFNVLPDYSLSALIHKLQELTKKVESMVEKWFLKC